MKDGRAVVVDAPGVNTPGFSVSISGDVAVVIGGTGVLGGGMADALAAYGAKVAILGRSEERGSYNWTSGHGEPRSATKKNEQATEVYQ